MITYRGFQIALLDDGLYSVSKDGEVLSTLLTEESALGWVDDRIAEANSRKAHELAHAYGNGEGGGRIMSTLIHGLAFRDGIQKFINRSGREVIEYRGFHVEVIDGFYVIWPDTVTVASVQTTEEKTLRWIDAHVEGEDNGLTPGAA